MLKSLLSRIPLFAQPAKTTPTSPSTCTSDNITADPFNITCHIGELGSLLIGCDARQHLQITFQGEPLDMRADTFRRNLIEHVKAADYTGELRMRKPDGTCHHLHLVRADVEIPSNGKLFDDQHHAQDKTRDDPVPNKPLDATRQFLGCAVPA